MKKQTLVYLLGLSMLAACSNHKSADAASSSSENSTAIDENTEDKTGSFTFDGTAYKGKITTQYFGDKATGHFSVLCQQDFDNGNFVLFQIIFHNEAEATGSNSFKPDEDIITIPAGVVNVAVSGSDNKVGAKQFHTISSSGGSISVSHKTITIKDLKLVNADNKEKMLSCELSF
jgi:hypothetical protein